jgi:hypothetical protein
MGYMRHHAIVITSCFNEQLTEVHAEAERLGCEPTPISSMRVNGYRSFLVPPGGSKEGWDSSEAGDIARSALVDFIRDRFYVDGGTYVDWAEVQFGDDEQRAKLIGASDLDEKLGT